MSRGACRICRFWNDHKTGRGECRRAPPIVTGGMMSHVETVWPTTSEDDWCGGFEAKVEEVKP